MEGEQKGKLAFLHIPGTGVKVDLPVLMRCLQIMKRRLLRRVILEPGIFFGYHFWEMLKGIPKAARLAGMGINRKKNGATFQEELRFEATL